MEFLVPLLALAAGFRFLTVREQRRRVRLLGKYLEQYRIEKLMESLLDGYLRALGEDDAQRRQSIWSLLGTAEGELRDQVQRLADDFSGVWADHALVSTLPLTLPYADKLFPRATFDMRHALHMHAQGISAVVQNLSQRSARDKAFMLTSEVLLLQHTCHWFCRSRAVANARLLRSHQTHYAQVIAAVSPQTRESYQRLVARTTP